MVEQRLSAFPRRLLAAAMLGLLPLAALAQDYPPQRFTQQSGADLYHAICQGCHMPDANGATGAGAYPALSGNRHLLAPLYPVGVVINGRKAMPAFGDALSDAQIAAVVNFVRSNFGNRYKDVVTPEMVRLLRPK
jgi:mono/diheme cytochrome c family protein